MTKKQNHAIDKRRVRRAEKNNKDDYAPTRDGMLGSACKRGWRLGIALK